jgi:transcriptional regulator with XRE-family HTH domain
VARVITTTLKGPPRGSTHWSTRTMATRLGMSASTVQRIWREHRLQPHRESTFKLSNDPDLEAKVTDIVGLYLHPPKKALVLCIDEKTMIQALDRTQPLLPMKPGQVARHTHDYVRNGTTDLFAALDVATGAVTHRFYERHRAIEFLGFLKLVARTLPAPGAPLRGRQLLQPRDCRGPAMARTTPADSFPLHAHQRQLDEPGRDMVLPAHRTGRSSRSVQERACAARTIQRFLDAWNENCHPFKWVKTADDIMVKAKPQVSSDSGH